MAGDCTDSIEKDQFSKGLMITAWQERTVVRRIVL